MNGPDESVLRLSGIHVNRLIFEWCTLLEEYSIETYHLIYAG